MLESGVVTFPKNSIQGHGWYDKEYVCNKSGNTRITIPDGKGVSTGIEEIRDEVETKYYDLWGREFTFPTHGVFIKVTGNKAEKVCIK